MNDDYIHKDDAVAYVIDQGLLNIDDICDWILASELDDLADIVCEVGNAMKQHYEKYAKNVNLCNSCEKEFATCTATPKFGKGKGHDNVILCYRYAEDIE